MIAVEDGGVTVTTVTTVDVIVGWARIEGLDNSTNDWCTTYVEEKRQ